MRLIVDEAAYLGDSIIGDRKQIGRLAGDDFEWRQQQRCAQDGALTRQQTIEVGRRLHADLLIG